MGRKGIGIQMKQNEYLCEGKYIRTEQNRRLTGSEEGLREAMESGAIIEGRSFLCDEAHDLHVSLGAFKGILPREECAYTENGEIKDIAVISRVGKPVCCCVTAIEHDAFGNPVPILSRKEAQRECLFGFVRRLCPGDVIDAKITHLDPFGAFCDIGCGLVSLLPIDCMSVSRINHPRERFTVGQHIRAVVRHAADEQGRLTLSHRELLGTWEENARLFVPGQTAAGIVRSVEPYGIFVELAPNLAGLAECKPDVHPGQNAAVYIKNVIPQKMKIKLVIIDVCEGDGFSGDYRYGNEAHIDRWVYSPASCDKRVETDFSAESE